MMLRKLVLTCVLCMFLSDARSESIVPDVTNINLAWVDGVYWNPEQLPGWGFFVDAQEETMFGAIYGYLGNDATFITLQGTIIATEPLEYQGNVFFVTDGGATVTDVGDFSWIVGEAESSPASLLTITSNILNVTDLPLIRLVYVEKDKIDILTAADWNIVTRVAGDSFAYHYAFFDDRFDSNGTIAVPVVDLVDDDNIGAASYFADEDGNAYGIRIPFLDETDLFAIFLASDTELFGRYWLLDPGEDPIGNGDYFQGSADTVQASEQLFETSSAAGSSPESGAIAERLSVQKTTHRSMSRQSSMEDSPMFPPATVQKVFEALDDSLLLRTPSKVD